VDSIVLDTDVASLLYRRRSAGEEATGERHLGGRGRPVTRPAVGDPNVRDFQDFADHHGLVIVTD
jgi:hypothetical protein